MTNGFEVRIAEYNDINDILEITKEAFEKYIELAGISANIPALNETTDDVKRDIDNKIVLIAFLDNVPVGSVRVEILPDNTAYLSRFGVKITSQNNGIGKSLMNIVDILMKQKGVKSISLHTCSKIHTLVRFYYGRSYYIDEITTDKGYIRAKLTKDYE